MKKSIARWAFVLGMSAGLLSAESLPLAALPSKPGPHLEKIKALGDNTWLNLGKPAPDPKFGAANGRSWSRKMAFAPDLRGAFLFGSGPHHGSSVRNGRNYYNDDIYFYDINAHAWVCAHPGTPMDAKGRLFEGIKLDPATKLDVETDDNTVPRGVHGAVGLNVDKDGNLIPVATSVHAYWTPEYDTDRKMFMFMPSSDPFGFVDNPAWSSPWASIYSPYYYDGRNGKFERRKAAQPSSGPNVDTAVFYSPNLTNAVYFSGGVWLYDHATNSWKKVNETGGGNAVYCHDPKSDLVYVVPGRWKKDEKDNLTPDGPIVLEVYDIRANQWTKPVTTGAPTEMVMSHNAFFTYDTANGVVVLYINAKHYIYDPGVRKWTAMPDTFPEKQWDGNTRSGVEWGASSAFYDPGLNAHFYFNAGDGSTEPGNMWVYRYKTGSKR